MRCLECGSEAVTERPERTAQGYRRFRCRACGKQFNERSGTLLNRTQYPSDVIALVVLWRLRYKLSLRDLPEMFAVRGIVFSYEAVREWEAKLTPALAEELRRRRRGKVGRSWYVDETYLKVQGRWCYLYRAIDRNGKLVDVLFSEHRDMAAAQAFFRSAKAVTGVTPDRVTTDGHDSYPRAIRTELGQGVRHRTSAYLNNRLEQDHRGIKGRYRPMRGFKCPRSAARFCRAYDELRNFLRSPLPPPPTRARRLPQIAPPPEDRDRAGHLASRMTRIGLIPVQAILAGASPDRTNSWTTAPLSTMRNPSGRGTTSNRRYRSRAWEITTARLLADKTDRLLGDHLRLPVYATDKFDVVDHMPLLSGAHMGTGGAARYPHQALLHSN